MTTTTTHEMDMHERMMTEAREMGAFAGEQRIPRDVVDAYHEAARATDGTHRAAGETATY